MAALRIGLPAENKYIARPTVMATNLLVESATGAVAVGGWG